MIFDSSEKLQKVLGGFFHYLLNQEPMRKKLLESKLIIQFNYQEPPLSITVDLKDKGEVTFNDQVKKPEVEMKMKADIAHRFWFGKVNLVTALARREMVAKGPIPKILKLLPIIKPAYHLYPKYLQESGLSDFIIT